MAGWKRWAMVGTGVMVVLILGYAQFPGRKAYEETWEPESEFLSPVFAVACCSRHVADTYTPNLDGPDEPPSIDPTDFQSPPFRPIGSGIAEVGDADTEEGLVHALPIDTSRPHYAPGVGEAVDSDGPITSPHDPTSDEAKGALGADEDFTEITTETSSNSPVMTFETDPDAASTASCADPYDSTRPLVQYALTIDAGSTGSRIHVYKFHNCGPSPQLEYETFKMINPGLSSYAGDPTAAAASLDPLLEEAKRVVPQDLWTCTPVEVKATAGLRLLGTKEGDAILDEVRNRLETNWEFVVSNERAVQIMDGKEEGEQEQCPPV